VLLTRLPLGIATSFDLHVLGTPPALVLSQDQTLHKKFYGALIGSKIRTPLTDRSRRDPESTPQSDAETAAEIVRSRDSQKTLPVLTLS
jgi:hypothetical protein